jgi:uncharacterized protein (DUF433 family)
MAKAYVDERDGGLYVAGARVSLDSIVHCFRERMSPETILSEFDTLTLAQVYGAITYYLENQPSVDAYRMRQEERFREMRQAAEPLPEDLSKRLAAARDELRSGR